METLIKIGEFCASFIGILIVVYVCGTSIGAFFFRRGEKNAEREIKKYFDSLRH